MLVLVLSFSVLYVVDVLKGYVIGEYDNHAGEDRAAQTKTFVFS